MTHDQNPCAEHAPAHLSEIAPSGEAHRKAVDRIQRASARALRAAIREAYADVAA